MSRSFVMCRGHRRAPTWWCRTFFASLTAVVALCGMLGLTIAYATPAAAGVSTLYVAQGGVNSGTCTSPTSPCATVTYALTQAASGATINVSGTIDDNVSISSSVTITGVNAPASSPAVLDGSQTGVVISVRSGGNATLDNLTVENGSSTAGGGIFNLGGTVAVNDSTITENSSIGNSGGGVLNEDGSFTVTDSTIVGNSAQDEGGGIENVEGGILTATDSTITGNSALYGGGIDTGERGYSTVVDSTIVGNSSTTGAGGGINSVQGVTELGASIIADNSGYEGLNCGGSVVSIGYNLTNDSSGDCQLSQPTDVIYANPELGALAQNGGPTQTMLPIPTSPAANQIPTGTTLDTVPVCPRTDQRGVSGPAPGETACAIGAVEPVLAPLFTTIASYGTGAGVAFSVAVSATGPPPPALGVGGGSTLPSGVSLVNEGDGSARLVGSVSSAGNYTFDLAATNGVGAGAVQVFTLTISPNFVSPSQISVAAGHKVSLRLRTVGSKATSIALAPGNVMPGWLTLGPSKGGSAVLSGVSPATSAGLYELSFTATSGGISSTQIVSLDVFGFTSADNVTLAARQPNGFTVSTAGSVVGSPVTIWTTNTLPPGVSLTNNGDGTGTLSGSPAVERRTAYRINIRAASDGVDVTQTFIITVAP